MAPESHIQKLPPSVISKLRSGVTVTSISQCVEELILNAVDSGATNIEVRVDLGIYRIQVVDNGHGISEQDMKIIGLRYATSKCQNLEDLKSNLTKYGYRGEALASVIQVSGIVDICSQYKKSSQTFEKLFIYGKGKSPTLSKHTRPSCGTTIMIQDFMYNMPVRRKLIKEALDIENIKSQMERVMLISHNVSIVLKNERTNNIILHINKSNSSLGSFLQVYGLEHERNMAEVYHSLDQFEIQGYIGTQPHQSKNLQFIYINNRSVLQTKIHILLNDLLSRSSIIRSKMPINSSMQGPGKVPSSPPKGLKFYPIYILNVIAPRSEYDICLEPKKTLVEFRDWEKLLLCVEEMVLKFVKEENLTISLDDRFRRSEKNISPLEIQAPAPHSSQAALQMYNNPRGKGNMKEHHRTSINERRITVSDLKRAVCGRPARRNSKLSTGSGSILENCDNNKHLMNEDNSGITQVVEQNCTTHAKEVDVDEDEIAMTVKSTNVRCNVPRSSLEALKQVIELVNETSSVPCLNNNNTNVKQKLSSLQELKQVSDLNGDPEDFVTPTNKIRPSVSPPKRDENVEETLDIYDNSKKGLIPQLEELTSRKSQSLSCSLGRQLKETIKKKKVVDSLLSFKFDKSVRNKANEDRALINNYRDEGPVTHDPERNSRHPNDRYRDQNDLGLNSPTKLDDQKKAFFNIDITEDISLDSINVNDLLPDRATFISIDNNSHLQHAHSLSPLPKTFHVFSPIQQRINVNKPASVEKATCQFLSNRRCRDPTINIKRGSEINAFAIQLNKKERCKTSRIAESDNCDVTNVISRTSLTQPFPIADNNLSVSQSLVKNVIPETSATQSHTDVAGGRVMVNQNLICNIDVITNSQTFNVNHNSLTSQTNLTTDIDSIETEVSTTTQGFNVSAFSEDKIELNRENTNQEQQLGFPLSENTSTAHIRPMESPVDGNGVHASALPFDSSDKCRTENLNTEPIKHSLDTAPKNSDKCHMQGLSIDNNDNNSLDIHRNSSDKGLQSMNMEPQSSSLDMNVDLRNKEESSTDSLSSTIRKNIIDFVSSYKCDLSPISRPSLSESIKKYSESSKLSFEGKVLHIGFKGCVDNSTNDGNSCAISSSGVVENSLQESSSINEQSDTVVKSASENLTTFGIVIPTDVTSNTASSDNSSDNSSKVPRNTSWKRVTKDNGESIYINIRTGNTSFVAPPADPTPNWKTKHLMGCSTLKIPITEEMDPSTNIKNLTNCFSLSHDFEAFLPSKRKLPPEKTVEPKVKRIESFHFNNGLKNSDIEEPLSSEKDATSTVSNRGLEFKDGEAVKAGNSGMSNEQRNDIQNLIETKNYLSSKTNEALTDFLRENLLVEDELSKWRNSEVTNEWSSAAEGGYLNEYCNIWEKKDNFAMDADILGSDLETGDQPFSYSGIKCYNIVHPYKFTTDMLKGCKVFGQVDNKFIAIALPIKGNTPHLIVLVDQHAADERVQLEKTLFQSYEIKVAPNGIRKKVLRSERVQAPIETAFQADQIRIMKNFRDSFFEVGLEFTQINDTSVLFHCIPYFLVAKEPNEKNTRRCQTAALIIQATAVEICENIRTLGGAAHIEDEGSRPLPRPLLHVMNTIACRSAIKFGDELSLCECKRLICALIECQLPFQCAHGRPSLIPIVDIKYLKLKKRTSRPNLKKLRLTK